VDTRLDHERLEVYQLALLNVTRTDELVRRLPRGSYLADQLHRAAISVALNIAEGSGEFSRREKARFYRMARRSAIECAAIIDVCDRLRVTDAARIESARVHLRRLVRMLIGLIKSMGTKP